MIRKILLLQIFIAVILSRCSLDTDNRSTQEIIRSVADKIISETVFEFKDVVQKPVLNLQVLDYKNNFDMSKEGVIYARSNLIVKSDTTIQYGFDYSGAVKIFVNGNRVYEGVNPEKAMIKEIAYNMFVWREKISLVLGKGKNTILIKMISLNKTPVFFMREIGTTVESKLTSVFSDDESVNNTDEAQWKLIGRFNPAGTIKESLAKTYPPEVELKDEYKYQGSSYRWKVPKTNIIKELVIPDSNTYKRESYIEWHYANGTTLMGMLYASNALKDKTYADFVSKVCSWNVANRDMLKKQFEDHYAIRAANYRMFRKSMLDDTSGPALPYLQIYLDTKNDSLRPVIDEMTDYVSNKQVRLEDGTFCRPEPVSMTVWADDLFMSVPFLVRMGELTGDSSYYDDVARQIINFNMYLFDEKKGIYKHGWFSPVNEKSKVYWGRANGWVIWAASEALLHLPKNHPEYRAIQNIFKKHIEGLLKYQDESGMWHQVLDKPESFKETSCTAMFIIGISRGVINGWLDKSLKENALRAWNELKTNITEDGTVKNICRGTGIGYDNDFYFNRKRFDNDPRGLGAVLTATAEVMNLEEMN